MNDNQTSITQLADTKPQIDCALRVQIPLNTPARNPQMTKDDHVRNNAFTPAAFALSKTIVELPQMNTKRLPALRDASNTPVNMEHDAQYKTSIRDYSMLAFSSRRAGKKEIAASAYASLAVIYDNQKNYAQAIDCYKQYLEIATEMNDVVGQGVALNNLAVNHMLLARPPSDSDSLSIVYSLSEVERTHLEQALKYNNQHAELADAGGKFVAQTNMGLCCGMLGDVEQASKHHQDALRIAIRMQTLYGQSIAVGNLGLIAMNTKDFVTAKTCFEQVN